MMDNNDGLKAIGAALMLALIILAVFGWAVLVVGLP